MELSEAAENAVVACVLTHHEYGEGWVWDSQTPMQRFGGVVGLIQHNTDEGQRLLETPSEILTKNKLN